MFGETEKENVHKDRYGHNGDWSAAASLVAGGSEAGDCRGVICAGASVSVVARHYDVNANQVFSWRKRFGGDGLTPSDPISPQMVPVIVTAEQRDDQASAPAAMIEIDLVDRYRIRVGNGVDSHALWKVLDLLERR